MSKTFFCIVFLFQCAVCAAGSQEKLVLNESESLTFTIKNEALYFKAMSLLFSAYSELQNNGKPSQLIPLLVDAKSIILEANQNTSKLLKILNDNQNPPFIKQLQAFQMAVQRISAMTKKIESGESTALSTQACLSQTIELGLKGTNFVNKWPEHFADDGRGPKVGLLKCD